MVLSKSSIFILIFYLRFLSVIERVIEISGMTVNLSTSHCSSISFCFRHFEVFIGCMHA